MNDAQTTREQRITRFIQTYHTLLIAATVTQDMEHVCVLLALRCTLRAMYPQDNANRTEPTYPWNINEGEGV